MSASFHVAVDHIDPVTLTLTTTYLGTCDQAHVDEVRAIAALPDSERFVKEHPHIHGGFVVFRDDGDLDVYVPVDATEYRVYPPDPQPRGAAGPVPMPTVEQDGPPPVDMPAVSGPGANDDMGVSLDLPRGATTGGPPYVDGAVRFGDQSIGGAMDTPTGPPRVVWHTTESPAGASYFYSVAAYLIRVGAEPQVIYDPVTDLLGQFGPLTQSGRALRNDGARRTNREGRVNVQVEVLGRAAAPWTKGFDPAKKPNYRKLLAAGRAHGVPDVWPAGKPPATSAAAEKAGRNRTTWQTKGGHYGHSQLPGQNHWDPGAIDTAIVPGKPPTVVTKPAPAKPPAASQYEPFPGAAFFHTGRRSPIVTAMGRRLVAEGCAEYSSGPGPQWTLADKRSYARWQRKCGHTGAAADGIPGKSTWDRLRVPKQL